MSCQMMEGGSSIQSFMGGLRVLSGKKDGHRSSAVRGKRESMGLELYKKLLRSG